MVEIDYNKNLERRQHLFDLYQDPNWILQAGLGDMEFEQDMYDDFMYGDPAQLKPEDRQFVEGELDFFGFPDDSYDKMAMAGLRKHATMGPYRYLDRTPYDIGPLEIEGDTEHTYGANYAQSINPNRPSFMDFNMGSIINDWRGAKYNNRRGNLQNQISDRTRHEYKHGLFGSGNPYEHPAIYGGGARYNLDPVMAVSDFGRFQNPQDSSFERTQYNPHRAGELAQETVQKYARPPKGAAGFNRGGIASLRIY